MTTPLAKIAEIESHQNNKYLVVNEAIRTLEALGLGAVESYRPQPPSEKVSGNLYIVEPVGDEAWRGFDNLIAQYDNSSWRFYTPFDGFTIFNKENSRWMRFDGTTWSLLLTDTYKPKAIALPYTLSVEDLQIELIVDNSSGVLLIPDSLVDSGFPDGWHCLLSLDGSGDITIEREDGSTDELIFNGDITPYHLDTQGSVKISHRTANVVKVY